LEALGKNQRWFAMTLNRSEQLPLGEWVDQKRSGAFFTPEDGVKTLVSWAVRRPSDRMLDPSCGDGRFLAAHRKSVGIEQNEKTAAIAKQRAPWALVHEGDFFAWAESTKERFECVVGNPPFIRYQHFSGEVRARAIALCSKLGAKFSALASSWAPFLVAAASLLKNGGRMAFVVPAEIGHAPYARPLIDFLLGSFEHTQIVAIRDKMFPQISEDCWLLYADGYGRPSSSLHFTVADSLVFSPEPPRPSISIPVGELRESWKMRLRPYLLPSVVREFYLRAGQAGGSFRLSEVANIGIGYVSGDNDFFHFRPSTAKRLGIPREFLYPTVRNGKSLPAGNLTQKDIEEWYQADAQVLLLKLDKATQLPVSVKRYLDSDAGLRARQTFKCRTRDPWYVVPDVKTPDFFLTYMSGLEPGLVRNDATCTCTNSVHSVRFTETRAIPRVRREWASPFVQLSCEIEGHPLGGGMLKLEPREAGRILIPVREILSEMPVKAVMDAISTMREWRHYAAS
jgi:tRNA1(Val) A37 N6-methylase TrmN6